MSLEKHNERIFVDMLKSGKLEYNAENGEIVRVKGGFGINNKSKKADIKHEAQKISRIMPNGYVQIRCMVDGKVYHCYVHRVIWVFYNGEIPHGMQVNHCDGVRSNNKLGNLELLSSSGNKKHASEHLGSWRGERNGNAKLTKEQVLDIRKLYENGLTRSQVREKYSFMNQGTINDIIARRYWMHI